MAARQIVWKATPCLKVRTSATRSCGWSRSRRDDSATTARATWRSIARGQRDASSRIKPSCHQVLLYPSSTTVNLTRRRQASPFTLPRRFPCAWRSWRRWLGCTRTQPGRRTTTRRRAASRQCPCCGRRSLGGLDTRQRPSPAPVPRLGVGVGRSCILSLWRSAKHKVVRLS
jgi:hypothetical protein